MVKKNKNLYKSVFSVYMELMEYSTFIKKNELKRDLFNVKRKGSVCLLIQLLILPTIMYLETKILTRRAH
jgi:hypothetical protein